MGVVVDADKQSFAHDQAAVYRRIALTMLLVFHAHSAWVASDSIVQGQFHEWLLDK